MSRAYHRAVLPIEPMEQLTLDDLLRAEVSSDESITTPTPEVVPE
jgi:hypothetical protein